MSDAQADDSAAKAPPVKRVERVAFAEDGSLIIERPGRLISIQSSGLRSEYALPAAAYVHFSSPSGRAVVVEAGDTAYLVTLAPLREVHRARGRALTSSTAVEVLVEGGDTVDAAAVLLAPSGTTVRLTPPQGKSGRIDSVDVTKTGRFAVVTWSLEHDGLRAIAYDVATGKSTGDAMLRSNAQYVPTAILDGERQVGIRAEEVVVLDLATGSVLRKARLACPPPTPGGNTMRGNPIVDPRSAHLLVTCDMDGVLLDARTLRPRRAFPSLVPGCDNGMSLQSAHFNDDGTLLVVEGCGGEARLDIATGRYACGDSDQLMGAAYEPAGPAPRPSRPIGVPPCHSNANGSASVVRLTPKYVHETTAMTSELVGPGNVRLPVSGDSLAVSPKEDRYAYIEGDAVIVRSLPGGAVLSEVRF